mmetsp:Transcript_3549/g.8445  ORF Transcript_3549/g.8445 Transcript_3549/m.8445 type:complete len:1412 (+) Transcript_3549:215-4450(+)
MKRETAMVNGRVLEGKEFIEHCKRHGFCARCGKRQTHKKAGFGWKARLEPIDLERDEHGNIVVYKGYCISPTCYSSIEQVNAIENGHIMDSPIARPGMHRPTLTSPGSTSSHSNHSSPSTRSHLLGSLNPPGLYQSSSVPMPSIAHDRQYSSSTMRRSDGHVGGRNTSITTTNTSSSGGSSDNENHDFGGPGTSGAGVSSSMTLSQISSSFTSNDNSSSLHSRSIQSSMNDGSFTTTGSQPTSSSWRQQQEQLLQNLASGSGGTTDTEESNPQQEQQNMELLSSSGRTQSSQSVSIAELEALIVQGDYIRFLNDLNDKGSDKTVALEGFKLLRYHFVEKQSESGFVLYEDWTKTTHDRMIMIRGLDGGGGRASSSSLTIGGDERETVDGSQASSRLSSSSSADKDVVVSGLLVFLTLSTLPGSYRKNMVEKGSVKLSLEYLTAFKGDKDVCDTATALFLSLSLKDKHGLNVKFDAIRILMQRLVRLVCNGEYGRDCALRALYYMSHQKKRPGQNRRSLSHELKTLFRSSDQNISALVGILKEPNLRQRTAESVLSLVWRMSIPRDDEQNEGLLPLSEELVLSLARLMEGFDSIEISESCCGILANLSMRNGFPFDSVLPCFHAIHGCLTGSNVLDEGLAISSSHAIRNMLVSDSCRKVLMSDNRILDTIILLLGQHSSSAEIVEYCCLALAHAGRYDYSVKETIVQIGGFDLVKKAFIDFAIERGDNEVGMIVKDASLCAMATISSCRSGNQAIRDGGFFDTLQTLLAVEVDRDFEKNLAVIIDNCQYDFSPDVSVERQETTVESPEQFASRVDEIVDPDSVALLFQGATKATADCDFLSTLGFFAIVDAMARFVDSANVQEHGCALLSELYFDPPVTNYSTAASAPWSNDCLNAALETTHKAMGHHRREASVNINACLTIVNICSRFPEVNMDVSEILPALFDDVLEGLLYHSSHQPSVTSGTSALLALIDGAVLASIDLNRWADRAVHVLSDSITRFPSDTKILMTALDIFLRLLNKSLCTSLMGSPPVIDYVRNLVSNDNADVVGRASATLACLVDMNFASASFIMESSEAVKDLVSAMAERADDLHIQINLCFIVASLINYGSDFAVHMQDCADVCLDATIKAITVHRNNPELIKHACCILTSFFPVVNTEASAEMNDSALSILNTVMDQHVEDAEVESHVFDALCSMSRKYDNVKVSLAEESRLRAIFAIMGLHIGSAEVQRSGCSLLSALCGHRPAKALIGQEGIVTIVHALLAHNQSSAVQKEGLLALKSLATESCNKQHISTRGGEDAVVYSLWIHYRDPSVLSTGLSALNNIAVDGASKTVSEMREQVLTIIIGAMARFRSDQQVQKNACFYLKSCSYLPANLQIMADHSEQLIPLLIQASETYPEQCEARAHSIIQKISHF